MNRSGDIFDAVFAKGTRVGLDIGAHSIKLIEVENSAQGPQVRTVAFQEMPHFQDTKGTIPDETVLTDNLMTLFMTSRIKTKSVQLVISDPAVYLRYLTIPKVDADELSKAIKWQAEKFVPFSIEDASVDYQVIETGVKAEEPQMGVIVAAAEKKIIDKYLNVLKAVKLTVDVIDIAPFSVAQGIIRTVTALSGQSVLIADIGYKTTSLMVVKGDALKMVRTIETAGDQVTRAIADIAVLDRATAERVKREFCVPVDETELSDAAKRIVGSVKAVLDEWAREIERSLTYCERESLTEGIDKVILCGGGAKLKGLDQFLHRKLGLPVETAGVRIKAVPGQEKIPESLGPEFISAYGGTL